MIKTFLARLHQGYRTNRFPQETPPLPDRFRGMPGFSGKDCPDDCTTCAACASACPTKAISKSGALSLDLGACIFCGECVSACATKNISFTKQHSLSARTRNDLVLNGKSFPECKPLEKKMLKLFGRSFKLRQVSAGGCGACEADINVLSTVIWDIGRFGIQVVASPRHADGLLVTGPVTENMRLALEKTYAALPPPRLVIASGACAISGGVYRSSPSQHCGVDSLLPIDLYIPGCPPHPLTILDGLLRLLGKIQHNAHAIGGAPPTGVGGPK
jgi:Ni,Fe-hydrogenase III small subunit/formate hydrogenlyase subunit 6/NADH:ubiquinone oxidoreductase subunit I